MAITAAVKELRESLEVKAPHEVVDWLNIMVYGDAGVGKTYLCGTAIELGPLLMIDIEGGMQTLRKHKNIDVASIRSMKELEKIGTQLAASVVKGELHYTTVAIDSGPELADLDMRMVMKQAYSANPEKVDIDVPSPREWGKVRNHIRLIVRHFRDLPCHTIWTAGVGTEQNEGMPTKYFPSFAGKLAREVPGFMDIVGYYRAKADHEGVIHRTLQFQGTERVVAKDRTGVLGATIEDPSIPMLWGMIQGERS